jgi:outer membrane protein assembly factor BamD (BamD/ComL family)
MADEAKRPLKVFLCHASSDKTQVRDLYRRLVAEGVDAWLDQEKLIPGQDWQLEISRAVREADVVVICLSNQSITKEGYVQKEIRFALDRAEEKPEGTIFLIPARLEDCSVPERLNSWQWVDLFDKNGFMKLLSSLKLRAEKVGAVIEPLGYEDADPELEHRLDQLYTEGLAAFWVEDWDKACQRFQTILREQPNHKTAAEKLAQAERQRNLARLYTQATAAFQSENWLDAIKALEDLLEESGEYKDALQLLKDAKKQRQLRELYAEAKRLHTAQKWHAVLRVIDQIAAIDSAYHDSEGLVLSAQKEAAELKRLADLNDQYRQGIHKMDAGEWYEARDLLEQVHKSQTGFHDTERLLRKIEDENLRIEEGHKRTAQVQMLYEQARKMTRTRQWGKALAQMEEIQKLDNQFVDRDGIIEKAKAELEREEQETQQRRELAALYAEAVSLLEAKKYQEALEQWNAIQAIHPNYKDPARVRATARRKLNELSQPEGVARPWQKGITDWFNTEADIPADHKILTEKLLLVSVAAIAIIHELWVRTFVGLKVWEWRFVSIHILVFVFGALLGGLYGTVVAFVLNKTIANWQTKHSLTVMVGWALAIGISWSIGSVFDVDLITVLISISSLATVAAIKWAKPATSPINMVIMMAGWALAGWTGHTLGVYLSSIYGADYGAVGDGVTVLLGLLFTFGMQVEGYGDILKMAFFGLLGFAIGNYIADTVRILLSLPAEISYALWGLIGGAALEARSRNSGRILSSAVIWGIGLLMGAYLALDVLPAIRGQYANSAFLDKNFTLRRPFLGIGLGLALGLLIRRVSATGVLVLLGVGVFLMTRALNAEFFPVSSIWQTAVRGSLIGLVMGYGYGYMRTPKPLEILQRPARTKWVWVGLFGLLAIAILGVIWRSTLPQFTPHRWDFDTSTQGWGSPGRYFDITVPKLKDGYLTFTSTGTDPQILSHAGLRIFASTTPIITIRMRVTQGQGPDGQIFFITNQDNHWDETKSVLFALDQAGASGTYNVLMSESPAWQGVITEIRFDPANAPTSASIRFAIDYISVHAP